MHRFHRHGRLSGGFGGRGMNGGGTRLTYPTVEGVVKS